MTDREETRFAYRRRTIMGALAATALATGGTAGAQDDADDADDADDDLDWVPEDASTAHAAVLSGARADVETDASGCAHVTPIEEDTLLFDLVLEDITCVTQAHVHEGERDEDGPIVAPLLEYTEELDGTGAGDPLTTDPDTPLIEGATVEDEELVAAILDAPDEYYVAVHTVHNPEGELRGQLRGYEPGQETEIEPEPAEFVVRNLDPAEATVVQGESVDISATVENVGDVTDTQTVELRIDEDVVADEEIELACRESTTVTFEDVETDELDPGEYEHGIFTDDDAETGTLTVLAPPEFLVSELDPEEVTVTQGDTLDISATIENAGEATGTQTVELRIDDDPIDDQELELDGGEEETVTFDDVETEDLDPGEYEHGIFTDDDSETGTLTVEEVPEVAEFLVSELDPEEVTVTQGDLVDISATIENVGDEMGTQTVELRIDDDPVDDQELELDGGEEETVTFEDVETEDLDPGEYEHGVFTDDDSETGTLTVEEVPEAAEFLVSELDPDEVTVTQGDTLDISATIENVGGETGTQTVELRIDDDPIDDQELELDGGEEETITFEDIETEDLDPGEYEHGVFTDDDSETGTLTVEEVPEAAEFLVSELDPVEATVTQGDTLDISATIENVGDEMGTQTVELRIDDDSIDDQELDLDGGGEETITFEDIETDDLDPGEYEHGIFTDDDSETGTLTVEAVEADDDPDEVDDPEDDVDDEPDDVDDDPDDDDDPEDDVDDDVDDEVDDAEDDVDDVEDDAEDDVDDEVDDADDDVDDDDDPPEPEDDDVEDVPDDDDVEDDAEDDTDDA